MSNDNEEDQSYLAFLRRGSDRHKVAERGPRVIIITPVSENNDDWVAFQQVVLDAIAYSFEGYDVTPSPAYHNNDIHGWSPRIVRSSAFISWENRPDLD